MILLWVVLSSLHANTVICDLGDLFEPAYQAVERLESEMAALRIQFERTHRAPSEQSIQFIHAQHALEHLTEAVIGQTISAAQARKKSEAIENQLKHIADSIQLESRRKGSVDFRTILDEPVLVTANRIYEVDSHSGKVQFSFNDAIVKELFWQSDVHSQRVATHFLRALSHGTARGSGTDGLIRLHGGNFNVHLFELKIVGKDGGHRLYAYDRDGHYRFLVYKDRHAASVNAENANREAVYNRVQADLIIRVNK